MRIIVFQSLVIEAASIMGGRMRTHQGKSINQSPKIFKTAIRQFKLKRNYAIFNMVVTQQIIYSTIFQNQTRINLEHSETLQYSNCQQFKKNESCVVIFFL